LSIESDSTQTLFPKVFQAWAIILIYAQSGFVSGHGITGFISVFFVRMHNRHA